MYNDSFRMRYGAAPIAIYATNDCLPTKAHIHNEIELLYIVNGSSKIKISDMCYDANAGDLFVVNPMEVHAITPEASPEYCHQCICFDCSMIVDRQLSAALQDGSKSIYHVFRAQEDATAALVALFQQLFLTVEQNSPALLFETSATISRFFAELTCRQLICTNLPANKCFTLSRDVSQYLAEHYSENLTSKDISEKLGYTQSYFCRLFKQNFGVPFSTYLNMYRILIAKSELCSSNRSIADIAAKCGFCDVAYFTKCFKNCTETTPLKYRKVNTVIKTG